MRQTTLERLLEAWCPEQGDELITKQGEGNTWTLGILQTFPSKKWERQHYHCTLTPPQGIFCKRKDVLQALKLLHPKSCCSENAVIQIWMVFKCSANKEKRKWVWPRVGRYICTWNLCTYLKSLFCSACLYYFLVQGVLSTKVKFNFLTWKFPGDKLSLPSTTHCPHVTAVYGNCFLSAHQIMIIGL